MALGGTKVMVYTSLDIASACIFSDPWSISAPSILQRFGFNAPPSIATDHVFGLAPGDPVITGMHNAVRLLKQYSLTNIEMFDFSEFLVLSKNVGGEV
jgi:hypothetical protein